MLFGLSAALADVVAYAPYFRSIFKGQTRPHPYSWLIWATTQGIAAAIILYGGGAWGAFSYAFASVVAIAIFSIAFIRHSVRITKIDTLVLIAAFSALLLWWQLDNALAAILMIATIDAAGYVPTLRKLLRDPRSEHIVTWTFFCVGNAFSLLALAEYNALTLTYILVIASLNVTVVSTCLAGRMLMPKER